MNHSIDCVWSNSHTLATQSLLSTGTLFLCSLLKISSYSLGKPVSQKATLGCIGTNDAFFLKPLVENFKSLNDEIDILKQLNHKNIAGLLI